MRQLTLLLTVLFIVLLGVSAAQSQYYGESLGESEQLAVANTFQYALEKNKSGDSATWNNPDSAHSGSTVPLRTYQTADGTYCREYQQSIFIGNKEEQGFGTACRQPDGSWLIVAADSVPETIPASDAYRPQPYRYYNPWRYAYPYSYAYDPRHIFFSFGFFHHEGRFFSGHRHFRSHKTNFRRNNSHFRGHRSHLLGHNRHLDRPHNKSHIGKRLYKPNTRRHFINQQPTHRHKPARIIQKGFNHKGKNLHGQNRHIGKQQHKFFRGERNHKARTWGKYRGTIKHNDHRSVRYKNGGFKRMSGKGGRGYR